MVLKFSLKALHSCRFFPALTDASTATPACLRPPIVSSQLRGTFQQPTKCFQFRKSTEINGQSILLLKNPHRCSVHQIDLTETKIASTPMPVHLDITQLKFQTMILWWEIENLQGVMKRASNEFGLCHRTDWYEAIRLFSKASGSIGQVTQGQVAPCCAHCMFTRISLPGNPIITTPFMWNHAPPS